MCIRDRINPGEFRNYYNIKQVSLKQSEAKLLDSVINYEIKNYTDADLTIGKVAKEFGISTSEVNRLIYFQFEKNFYEYLDFLRISKAVSYTHLMLQVLMLMVLRMIITCKSSMQVVRIQMEKLLLAI